MVVHRIPVLVLVGMVACSSVQDGDTGGSSGSGGGSSSSSEPVTVLITFDELELGEGGIATVEEGHYLPHVRFVVGAGFATRAYEPHYVLERPSEPLVMGVQNLDEPGGYVLSEPLEVVFPSGASKVRFFVLAVSANGRFADVVMTLANGTTETVELVGLGTPSQPIEVNLESHGQLQRFRVQDIQDSYGVAYDSFSFTVP